MNNTENTQKNEKDMSHENNVNQKSTDFKNKNSSSDAEASKTQKNSNTKKEPSLKDKVIKKVPFDILSRSNNSNKKDSEEFKKQMEMMQKSQRRSSKGNKQEQPQSMFNNIFFYIFVILIGYVIFGTLLQAQNSRTEEPITRVIEEIRNDNVQNITVLGDSIEVQLQDGDEFTARKETSISFDDVLANNDIDRSKIAGEIKVVQRVSFDQIITPLITIGLPLLIIFFIFRQMRGAGNDIFAFGKSKAKLFNKNHPKVTFDDVAGVKEAKTELVEIVDFLKAPKKYRDLGARIPKGVLLVGPAGVGKTLLAKAIAGEANVPFFSVAGSEFMEMLVGVGSARARDLFKMAKENQPSLIFIDEIDAIGRQRGMGIGGGHDEREQTLNQILIEMDGFDPRTEVIVLAATNRPDMLDPALVRAGRFDRRVTIQMPDLPDREGILKIHMRGKPIADDVSIEKVAKRTVGLSGADLENMLNEAAILTARENKTKIGDKEIDEAILKVTMGSERRTLQDDYEKKLVAYHEAGHALVATFVKDMDPVSRISIIARGGSLGHTSFPPDRDRYNETKTRLNSIIATALGGRAAEEVIFNEQTIGASNDIERATALARRMVTEFGMSEIGPISFDGEEKRQWLAKGMNSSPHYSDDVAAKIDSEVKKIIDNALSKAKEVLNTQRALLDKVSEVLLEKETILEDEYNDLVEEFRVN